jgi:putative glutamine amidotransferase
MNTRPRIAIPHPHSASPEYVARVLPQYSAAVEQAGGEAIPAALDLGNEEIAQLVSTCAGVLLPGSRADINPERYNAARHPLTAPPDPKRDNADELLLQDAYNMHKLILGICYGLQSLNVWRSGSLVQHVLGPVRHFDEAPNHRVAVAPDSRLAAILGEIAPVSTDGELDLMVNSSHHQAAAIPGDGLRVVARCPEDQVIEALEGTAPDHWVVAVQWHPERMQDAASLALFRALIEAARERSSSPRNSELDFESVLPAEAAGETKKANRENLRGKGNTTIAGLSARDFADC